jgi:CRP/FNR family transcriptional regulator, cyclic AMP receptor protein
MSRVPTGPRFSWDFEPTGRRRRGAAQRGIAERERALAPVPLFAGLSKRHLRAVARASGIAEHREGRTMVQEGASGSVFFVILEGAADVVRKGRRLARLGPGDFFGEMSLLDGGPRTASVVTVEPSRFLTLSGRDFQRILGQEPALASRLLKAMASRLREQERPLVG